MTAQIPDTILFEDDVYVLVGRSGDELPSPESLGVEHVYSWSTGSGRGYMNEYCVADSRLVLKSMVVASEDTSPPRIVNVDPIMLVKNDNRLQQTIYFNFPVPLPISNAQKITEGLWHYPNLGHQLDFSGRLILGQDFIGNFFKRMGYQWFFGYSKVIELRIVSGLVVNYTDISDVTETIRNALSDFWERNSAAGSDYFTFQKQLIQDFKFDDLAPY